MHHLILNIGLGPPVYAEAGPGDPVARFTAATDYLQLHGRVGNYDTLLDKLGEPVLVVHYTTERHVETVITGLATVAGQDCVACWDCNAGHGELYGPQAGPWRPFRLDLFLTLQQQGEHQ